MNCSWGSSFGPSLYTYKAVACYDLLMDGQQELDKTGLGAGDRFGMDTKLEGETYANLTRNTVGGQPIQDGALVSFAQAPKNNGDTVVTVCVGRIAAPSRPPKTPRVRFPSLISMQSASRVAQHGMRSELRCLALVYISEGTDRSVLIPRLNRVELDPGTNDTVLELFYSSLYRSFLSPNNGTDESRATLVNYCTWDTFRTAYPFLSLHSPSDYAEIVENYIDGWRETGWIPECRANNLPGLTQGGSDGTNVLADFAVKDRAIAQRLGVDLNEMCSALLKGDFQTPPEWDSFGRQIGVYEKYSYIPFAVFDTHSSKL